MLFPMYKIGHLFGLPNTLSYPFALCMPLILLNSFVNQAFKRNCITLVKHSPQTNHLHSSSITLQVVIRSAILGILASVGLSFINGELQSHFVPLGFYLLLLSFFHFSEFFVTSLTNPSTLSPSSFLLEHSAAYVAAISGSFLEYAIEIYFFPGFKKFNVIAQIGLLIAIGGEAIRKLAMFTAGPNFSHLISSEKRPQHRLVKTGIYSMLRHPSYAGWFYWAIGTQILLLNPISTAIFAIVSREFFKDRITYEEATLVEFFGDEYRAYAQKVGLWMPIGFR